MRKSLMIIGTASGVGKSTISLGLCRILYEDGYAVAPFKAQNISDNAHICPDGRELARSQALAAYACGLEPHPDMNPLLIKPLKGRTEIVLGGEAIGNMSDFGPGEMKARASKYIAEAYARLEARSDIIIIEGAGSPVELNIRENDIVNMKMALLANAPVILAADISAGGVYASVYGTLELLRPEERALVKGIIVNKIIGDPASFSGIKSTMEELTKLPVLGILPYTELRIEDEDGLIDARTGAKPAQTRIEMETEFTKLAEVLRENLNMPKILQIIDREGE